MATVTNRPNSDIWDLTITTVEHNRLVALGNAEGRLIASSVSDTLGLGRFVPVNTNDQGQPIANTDWFTAHPDAEAELTELADAINDLLDPGNLGQMQAIVAQMRRAPEDSPLTDKAEIRRQFNEARS